MRAWLRPKAPTPITATLIGDGLGRSCSRRSQRNGVLSQFGGGMGKSKSSRRKERGLWSACFLQQRNLAGVIELVLRHTVEHVVEVVPVRFTLLAGNLFRQAMVGEGLHGVDEFVVDFLRI